MSRYSYTLGPKIGARATLGLIALQSDETIEPELQTLFAQEGVALYTSRVPSGAEVTRETLAQMAGALSSSAALLPPSLEFDAIGYGCTSGTSVIGQDQVSHLIGQGADTRAVTEPVSALIAACAALGVARLAFLSPYVPSVSEGLRQVLEGRGITCPRLGSFEEAEEARVARITPDSIRAAARDLAQGSGVEAVFLSCTNLRSLGIIDALEDQIGLPVLSSNQVLAWHMARLADLTLPRLPGRLAQV